MLYLQHLDSKKFSSFLGQIAYKNFDQYCFVGRSALLESKVDKILNENLNKIHFGKIMQSIQYKYRDNYLDYIDSVEEKSKKKYWWASWLSWKNPWISSFYIKVCQVLSIMKFISDLPQNISSRTLVLVEEESVFNSLDNLLEKKNISYESSSDKLTLDLNRFFKKGISKRLISPVKLLIRKIRLSLLFKDRIFKHVRKDTQKVFLVPTFIDSRSFREGGYMDPFMGKTLSSLKSERNELIVIIPIVKTNNFKKLELFKVWLKDHGFYVLFPESNVSFSKYSIFSLQELFNRPGVSKFRNFEDVYVDEFILEERWEEWGHHSQSLLYWLSSTLKCFRKINIPIITIYPFENQAWERVLNKEISNFHKILSIGVQNAPAPFLSTRFFFSSIKKKELPLPSYILANGEVSFEILSHEYSDHVKVLRTSTSRNVTQKSEFFNQNNNKIMVACSPGYHESTNLIYFVVQALAHVEGVEVVVVPHPLVSIDYTNYLTSFSGCSNIHVTGRGFKYEFDNSGVVIFDSSTVGLEAMLNHKRAIHVAHSSCMQVNPNEYDKEYTRTVFTPMELKECILANEIIDYTNAVNTSLKYFGLDNSRSVAQIIQDIVAEKFNY